MATHRKRVMSNKNAVQKKHEKFFMQKLSHRCSPHGEFGDYMLRPFFNPLLHLYIYNVPCFVLVVTRCRCHVKATRCEWPLAIVSIKFAVNLIPNKYTEQQNKPHNSLKASQSVRHFTGFGKWYWYGYYEELLELMRHSVSMLVPLSFGGLDGPETLTPSSLGSSMK